MSKVKPPVKDVALRPPTDVPRQKDAEVAIDQPRYHGVVVDVGLRILEEDGRGVKQLQRHAVGQADHLPGPGYGQGWRPPGSRAAS